ncbi:hypothetical protein SUGI_1488380 [Cryptomeria japonica]|uniref:GPCR family 3 nine cysteines domain-containing protein n=1 Tax=Cryptomeria japonica TaxID=3369 RepID=A0AAD3NT89_CRYJA|nr:hypothetical protein SUGI_1488380 [Cryptomeria japonica]
MAFVQKSIITMALGLDSMQRTICPPGRTGLCPRNAARQRFNPFTAPDERQLLVPRRGGFYFDEQGDPPGKYEILNFQRRRPPVQSPTSDSAQAEILLNQDHRRHGATLEDTTPPSSPANGDLLLNLPAAGSISAAEQSLLEKRRLNPLYDSYSTLKVFRPHENAGHTFARARRARRVLARPVQQQQQQQQAHPPASGYSSASGYEYVHVGSWKSSDGLSFFDHIRWPATMGDLEDSGQIAAGDYLNHQAASSEQAVAALTPKSVCSLPCAKGHAKKIQSDSVKCCWVCVPCRPNEYLFNEFKCKACEKGWWPNAVQTGKSSSKCFKWRLVSGTATGCKLEIERQISIGRYEKKGGWGGCTILGRKFQRLLFLRGLKLCAMFSNWRYHESSQRGRRAREENWEACLMKIKLRPIHYRKSNKTVY